MIETQLLEVPVVVPLAMAGALGSSGSLGGHDLPAFS